MNTKFGKFNHTDTNMSGNKPVETGMLRKSLKDGRNFFKKCIDSDTGKVSIRLYIGNEPEEAEFEIVEEADNE